MEHTVKKAFALLLLTPALVFGHGEHPRVVAGNVMVTVDGKTQVIKADDKSIVQFTKFHVAPDETTVFSQPSKNASVLCRVTGREVSNIQGRLEANGKLLFINPNGIIFSETSHVQVGTLIASTLNIKDADFLKGDFRFALEPGSESSGISNKGHIVADQQVVLMAPHVFNKGIITARTGTVSLLGGEFITLSFDEDDLISFVIEKPLKKGVIEQDGHITAQQVFLDFKAAQNLIKDVVNVAGIVEANQIKRENGVVYLTSKSHTESRQTQVEGESVVWMGSTKTANLTVKADTFNIGGKIDTRRADFQISKQFLLGGEVTVHDSALGFNAPVTLTAPNARLSARGITFGHEIVSDPLTTAHLSLEAAHSPITFNGPISLDHLTIENGSTVVLNQAVLGKFDQIHGTETTQLNGPFVATRGADIKTMKLKVTDSVTCERGGFNVDISDITVYKGEGSFNVASFQQRGPGVVFAGKDISTSEGGVIFQDNVIVVGRVTLSAAGGRSPVIFQGGIDQGDSLTVQGSTCLFQGDIGKISSIGRVVVNATGTVTLSNVKGVDKELSISTPTTVLFRGTDYTAERQHYTIGQNADFGQGQKLEFFSWSGITFNTPQFTLNPATDLSLITGPGTLKLPPVKGSNYRLTAQSQMGEANLQKIEGGDRVVLGGGKLMLHGEVDANSVKLIGPISLQTASESFTLLAREGDLHLTSSCKGDVMLHLQAPKGKVILDGPIGTSAKGEPKFKSINVNGLEIDQNNNVQSTNQVVYTANRIFLGGDVRSQNDIIFNGPVTVDNVDGVLVASGRTRGNLIFMSTIDADQPTRTLILGLGSSGGVVSLRGDVGVQGPLGELKIETSKVELKNVGGMNRGVTHHLEIKAPKGIDLQGVRYNAGRQTYETSLVNVVGDGPVTFTTHGQSLHFSNKSILQSSAAQPLTFETKGGAFAFNTLKGQNHQPIQVQAAGGQVMLGDIDGSIGSLNVQGYDIVINGAIKADSLFLEAGHEIAYTTPENTALFNAPTLMSEGEITLNAKQGMIGSEQYPIHVETKGRLQAGAKSFAYLAGTSNDGECHVYTQNKPPRLFFNGNEYQYLLLQEYADEEQLMTLAPDLWHKIPSGLIDGTTLKPRKAPILYQKK